MEKITNFIEIDGKDVRINNPRLFWDLVAKYNPASDKICDVYKKIIKENPDLADDPDV